MSDKKQPIRRCIICQQSVSSLAQRGIRGLALLYASDFIKQAISLILAEHKSEMSPALYRKLHELRKLRDDACLCEVCAARLHDWFTQARRKRQAQFRLDPRDTAPKQHQDRFKETEAPLTPAEEQEFRKLIKSLRSGDGPAVDEV